MSLFVWRSIVVPAIFCVSILGVNPVYAQNSGAESADGDVAEQAVVVTADSFAQLALRCPVVDCDCESISGIAWVQKCYQEEQNVIRACAENDGVPQNFCGYHGPAGTPVALSIGEAPISVMMGSQDITAAKKQIAIRYWSLKSDIKSIEDFLAEGRPAEAVHTQKLFERNLNDLFGLHYSVHRSLILQGESKEAKKIVLDYIDDNADVANELNKFSLKLWREKEEKASVRSQKAYEVLSFHMGRSVGKIHEHSAALLADENEEQQSAKLWQEAANIGQRLALWAEEESKSAALINAYQQQVLARLQRETLYWLASEKPELAAEASANAEQMLELMTDRLVQDNILVGGTGGLSAP